MKLRNSIPKSNNPLFQWVVLLLSIVITAPNFLYAESFFDPAGSRIREGIDSFYDKDYEKAYNRFEEAENNLPSDPRIEFNKGSVRVHDGKHAEAITHLEKSLDNPDPEWKSKSYYNLGKAYSAMGDRKKALDSYRKALDYDSKNKDARKNLELLYRQKQSKQGDDSESNSHQNKNNNQNSDNSQDKSSGSNDQEIGSGKNSDKNQNSNDSGGNRSRSSDNRDRLSEDQADRIMDSLNPERIQRKKNRGFFQLRKDKFW